MMGRNPLATDIDGHHSEVIRAAWMELTIAALASGNRPPWINNGASCFPPMSRTTFTRPAFPAAIAPPMMHPVRSISLSFPTLMV